MNGYELAIVKVLSIAGSTFAMGITLGWILALLYFGGISARTDPDDKEN